MERKKGIIVQGMSGEKADLTLQDLLTISRKVFANKKRVKPICEMSERFESVALGFAKIWNSMRVLTARVFAIVTNTCNYGLT